MMSPQVNPICIDKAESPRRRYLNSPARKCWESVSWKTSPFGTVQSGASAACTVEWVDRECHPLRDSAQRDTRQPSTYVLGYLDSVALRLVAGQECHRSARCQTGWCALRNQALTSTAAFALRSAYSGNASASSSTSRRIRPSVGASLRLLRASAIHCPTCFISRSFIPRVVKAGVPTRMPLGFIGGLVSKGMAFLLTVIPASPKAFSASLPNMPLEKTSTSIRCVSV